MRRLVENLRDHAHHLARAERHFHPRAFLYAGLQLRRHEVIKLPADSDVQCHSGNHAMAGQLGPCPHPGARRKPNEYSINTNQPKLGWLLLGQKITFAAEGLGGFTPALGQAQDVADIKRKVLRRILG